MGALGPWRLNLRFLKEKERYQPSCIWYQKQNLINIRCNWDKGRRSWRIETSYWKQRKTRQRAVELEWSTKVNSEGYACGFWKLKISTFWS